MSIHTSHSTAAWFIQNQVTVINWPAVSPDLNIMENLWGVLAWDVYAHGRQFSGRFYSEIKAISREELVLFRAALSSKFSSKHA